MKHPAGAPGARAATVAVCGLLLAACGGPERIVLVVVDTLRADALGTYGGPTPTPNLDALAASGRRHDNAVASFHQTPMSMTALFTGRTPSLDAEGPRAALPLTSRTACGLARLRSPEGGEAADPRRCIPESVPTLAELLRGRGYATLGVTSNALLFAPFGIERGFDDWVEVGLGFAPPGQQGEPARQRLFSSRNAGAVNPAALALLRRRSGDRFFLYVHYMDVHDYGGDPSRYPAAVGGVDAALGELLAELREDGLLEGALVVVTSDHGERLGETHFVAGRPSHGGNPSFEEVLRVPLVVAPARFGPPDALLRGQDLFAWLARVAGARPELPVLLRPDELYLGEEQWQTYRRGRFKSYRRRSDGRLTLVDLESDPAERRDLSHERPELAAEHEAAIGRLAQALAARTAPGGLTPDFAGRLRALGYLE